MSRLRRTALTAVTAVIMLSAVPTRAHIFVNVEKGGEQVVS